MPSEIALGNEIIVAVGTSVEGPRSPTIRVQVYHPNGVIAENDTMAATLYTTETVQLMTKVYTKSPLVLSYFSQCHYPLIDSTKEVFTIMSYTEDGYYPAVSNKGETTLFTTEELLSGSIALSNLEIHGNSLVPLGWLANQPPLKSDMARLIKFRKALNRVSKLGGNSLDIGNYVCIANGDLLLSKVSATHSENFIVMPGTNLIGYSAFCSNSAIKHIAIPDSVRAIGDGVCEHCESLESINLPNGLQAIPIRAFQDCRNLPRISLPSSIKTLGFQSFSGCTALISIDLPTELVEIGQRAFSECQQLTSITIPSNVKTIESAVFSGCKGLSHIYINRSAGSISGAPWGAPSDCTVHWINP